MLLTLTMAAVALLSIQVVLVIVVSASGVIHNIYVTIIIVCLATVPGAVVSDAFLIGRALTREGRLFLVLSHLALGGLFFHFMTLPDRSVTLRILVELMSAAGESLSANQLRQRYSIQVMIRSRLEQLSAAGFLDVTVDGHIRLTRKGLWFGRFVTMGRRIFGIASAN
ncbi:MAG: hypothetical protein C5B57_09915 [Blastocatellia bacterium]|nr:MAG: hypothetical protein C5B57_09915 [Blastocatellia bacterium]